MIKSRIAVAGVLLAVAGAASAGTFSVTPTIASDYDFRGVTQTDGDVAFQLGGTYNFDNGFYAGAWGSNVKDGNPLTSKPDIELDYFAGFAGETDMFGYDVGVIYYHYLDAGSLNTVEAYAGISKEWFSAKLSYSPDVASSDESSIYLETNANYALPSNFSLLAHVGYATSDAFSDYVDYSVGVGYSINNFDLAVKYVDNDMDLVGDSRGAVVATISTTLPW